jgi:hypothetical protein
VSLKREGLSIRGMSRLTGCSRGTFSKWPGYMIPLNGRPPRNIQRGRERVFVRRWFREGERNSSILSGVHVWWLMTRYSEAPTGATVALEVAPSINNFLT